MIRHIIPISGKDSLATALVQMKREPSLPYEFMFNPTGAEYPVVYEWLKKVEFFLGKEIVFIGEDLESIIEDQGYFLPGHGARYCTVKSKIKPMEKWLGQDTCYVYYGIRADENREGYVNPSGRIIPVLPLQEENINIDGVYDIITSYDLKPPSFFWQSMYDEVVRILGGGAAISALFKPWQIDVMFAGRTRANCYFCYFQQLIEWVWLLETYPDLFWKAESYEHLGSNGIYHWNGHYSLSDIAKRAKSIKRKHALQLVKKIRLLSQGKIFFDDEKMFVDLISTTSCGLFCGK